MYAKSCLGRAFILDMAGLESALEVQQKMGMLTADFCLEEMVCQL